MKESTKKENANIEFYEKNIEHLQFVKTCLLQAHSFYENFPENLDGFEKAEIINYFFEMEKGKCTNQLDKFFINIHKQIESFLNYSILNIITLKKLKNDFQKTIKNSNGEVTPLHENIFYGDKEYNLIKEYGLEISSLSFTAKINIFYIYFIESNQSRKGSNHSTYRHKKLPYPVTNIIHDMRNFYSHGNYQASEKKMRKIKEVIEKHQTKLYWFYIDYYKVLYTIKESFVNKLNVQF